MVAEAARDNPREVCGLLLGVDGRVVAARPAENIAIEPERYFEVHPKALIDAQRAARGGGPQIMGYYHSHPNGRREPSETDRKRAAGDGKVWAIVSQGLVCFWRDEKDGFEQLTYSIVAA